MKSTLFSHLIADLKALTATKALKSATFSFFFFFQDIAEVEEPQESEVIDMTSQTETIETAATPLDALALSLNIHGSVNMQWIQALTGLTTDQLASELQGKIFFDPISQQWQHHSVFISGNIYEKIDNILALSRELSEQEQASLSALHQAKPEPVPYHELEFNLGERWIPDTWYSDFASELFQERTVVAYTDVNDTYCVRIFGFSPAAYRQYAYDSYHGDDLLIHALHDTVPNITKEVLVNGEKTRVPDEDAIAAVSAKIQEIKAKFQEWMCERTLEQKDFLTNLYNRTFNCYVRPAYDGSMQTFPQLNFSAFPFSDLYPSQKDAIWMLKQNGGGVCWHEVGAGKTLVMCVAAFEMKRLGLVRKPLIIGLKANIHEIADTYRKAYPKARLLYPGKEDFSVEGRKRIFSQIQTEDWDCIILTHDQFGKIPQSEEVMHEIFTQELMDVERCLEVLEDSEVGYTTSSKRLRRGLEIRQQNLFAKLAELEMSIKNRKDNHVDFRTMGIDHIFVDECHQFKNLMFQTRHNRVAGLGNSAGSQRAMNLLFAIRDIQARTGRDLGATFLSGTVVTNALTELYVIFKYLRPQALIKQNVRCFDAWAAVFTKKSTDYELAVTGEIKRKERFRTYIKLPELAAFLRQITDYRTADMINLDVPDKNVRFLSAPPTPEQEVMIGRLVNFAKSGVWADLGLPKLPPANIDKAKMLIATDIAQKMSLDMRLLSPDFTDDNLNKANRCANEIYKYYTRYNSDKGTQFVFSDLATYKPGEWNIYDDIKDKLIRLGIPEHEIKFIQKATTEKARKQLFDDMNSGRVRILFGSTTMLGTGVNAQQRAVAVHHLNIPWRPADLEQRNGRAVRKGNTVKVFADNKVDVIIYGTEKTLDAYKFNLLKNKQMFINQINNGEITSRRMDEDQLDENSGMNFAEFVAVLSGNQDLLNKAKLDAKIMQLEKELSIFNKNRMSAERSLMEKRLQMKNHLDTIDKMQTDYDYYHNHATADTLPLITYPLLESSYKQVEGEEKENIGRKLHAVASMHRASIRDCGTFIGLPLLVKSEYTIAGTFAYNTFYAQGITGLNYKIGSSGCLPLSNAQTAEYPHTIFSSLPARMEGLRTAISKVETEIPMFQNIINGKWTKHEQLAELLAQRDALQRKIDTAILAA